MSWKQQVVVVVVVVVVVTEPADIRSGNKGGSGEEPVRLRQEWPVTAALVQMTANHLTNLPLRMSGVWLTPAREVEKADRCMIPAIK